MRTCTVFLLLFLVSAIQCLECPNLYEGLTGNVVNSSNPAFSLDMLDTFQGYQATPCVVVFCETEQDVINAVNFARQNNIPPSVRSGRHSYMAYSVLNSSVVIDVSGLNSMIYVGENTIKFGAGVRLIEAYDFSSQLNLVFPGGTCPGVGLSGFVLGGGYGFWSRKYGLAIDSLVSLDIVLPSGDLITANETNYSDLFWACRGGGNGNFGVVTSLTLTLGSLSDTQEIVKYKIDWDMDLPNSIFNTWQNWLATIPDELTANLIIYHTTLSSSGIFIGSAADLKPIIAPLLNVGTILNFNISSFGLREAIVQIAGCTNFTECLEVGRQAPVPSDRGFRGKSSYVQSTISADGIENLLNFMQGPQYHTNCSTCAITAVMIDSYGGKINSFSSNYTAFPHRNMTFHMQTVIYWQNITSPPTSAVNTWVGSFYASMLPFVTPYAYVNYIDKDVLNWENAYYATNYPQLQIVKKTYDPTNLFSYAQSIQY